MPAKLLKTGFALLWLALVGAGSTGCTTTAKLDHFGALSQAGVAYARAVDTLIDTAATGSIEADTATLLVQRELEEDRAARREALTQQSRKLREQLAILGTIRRHQSLIEEYFVALGALADAGDADSAIGSAASSVVTSLGKLSSSLTALKVGDQSVGDFVSQGAPLLVAALRSRALEKELRANGAAINRELMISEGLMAFLAEKIRADDAAVQGPREADAVFAPFIGPDALPRDWAETRAVFLRRAVDVSAIDGAQDAARKLRTALIAASEGHLAPGQLQSVVTDLNALTDLLENIKGHEN